MSAVTINQDIPWINGMQVVETMAPAFRDNLGPAEGIEGLMSRFNQRQLYFDPETGRRIDHVRMDADYVDLTCAYHDSVEECLVLDGALHLDGEGDLVAGDYFWRPPGFIHCAWSKPGFEAILMMEGLSPTDGSGPVSRVVHPHEEAGHNPLITDHDAAVGPRGWVRRQPSGHLPWTDLPEHTWPNSTPMQSRTLSHNVVTEASSRLVRVPAGAQIPASVTARERFIVVLSGELHTVTQGNVAAVSLIHVPAGETLDAFSVTDETRFLLKSGPQL